MLQFSYSSPDANTKLGAPSRRHLICAASLPPHPFLPRSYAGSLGDAAREAMRCVRLTHVDPVVAGQSMSFAILVAALVQVQPLAGRQAATAGGLCSAARRRRHGRKR